MKKRFLKELQREPEKGKLLHADFQRVSSKTKLKVTVPVKFINEEECHGVKMEGGVLTKAIREIEISCLASNIPESIDVDVLELKLNESIRLTELSLGEGVEIPNLDESNDQMVVNVITPKEIVEEEPIIEDEAEGEAEGEDASTDQADSASEDASAEGEDSAQETPTE